PRDGFRLGRPPRREALPALAPPRPIIALAARRAAFETLLALALGAGDFLARRLIDHLHGKPHLAAVIEAQELHIDLLAFLDDIAHRLGTALGQLGDVYEAVLGAEEVHEGAELHDLDHLALVNAADLGLGGNGPDAAERRLDRLTLGGGDLDGAVVLDVDLG